MARTKEKEYRTLTARIPQELVAQVYRYAVVHRVSVGELIRQGLEWAIAQADIAPRQRYSTPGQEDGTVHTDMTDMSYMYDMDFESLAGAVPEQPPHSPPLSEKPGAELLAHTPPPDTSTPAFDKAKYRLGKLCPRRHDHAGTGQSLLRITNRHCLACDREKFHERQQAKRQAHA
jgi:hypothetical protein